MKIRKTMTESALRANQANAKRSKGPNNTDSTRFNAVTHGFLAKKIAFRTEDDKKSFEALLEEQTLHECPVGPNEEAQVSEMALSLYRLQEVYSWEFRELNKQQAAATILEGLRDNPHAQELALFRATQAGWTAHELVVRNGTRSTEDPEASLDDVTDKTGHIVLEAKMSSSLELILRYGTAIRHDYYRALACLRELQRQRFEAEQLLPVQGEEDHEGQ